MNSIAHGPSVAIATTLQAQPTGRRKTPIRHYLSFQPCARFPDCGHTEEALQCHGLFYQTFTKRAARIDIGPRVRFDAGPEHAGCLFATVVKRNRKTVA